MTHSTQVVEAAAAAPATATARPQTEPTANQSDLPDYSTGGLFAQAGNLDFAADDIERAVLSALINDPEAYDKIKGWVFPEHFQIIRWRWVFEAICDLRDDDRSADYVTVPDELERRGRLLEVGGAAAVMELGIDNGDWWSVSDYAHRLVEHSVKQKTADVLSQAMADLHRNGSDGATVLNRIAASLDELRTTHITASDFATEPPTENTLLARLVVPMPKFTGLGLVGEIADLIHEKTNSPRSYCLLTALAVTATATRRKARVRMDYGDVFPNVYGGLVGASSVFHKTTGMNVGRELLRRSQQTDLVVPSLPTTEGLINHLANKPAGLLCRDEVATLFGSQKIKYLPTFKQELMVLYDCGPYSKVTVGGGTTNVEEPFLSILGTTTPTKFFDNVNHDDWHDGFLVRWLIALPDVLPNFDSGPGMLTDDLDKKGHRLAMSLAELSRSPATDFAIDKAAYDRWYAWRRGRLSAASQAGDDLLSSFAERYAAYAMKIAILLATSTSWGRVTADNLETGLGIVEHFETCIMTLRDSRQDYGVSGGKMQRIFAVIRDRGPNLSAANVYRFANMPKSEAEPVIEKLLAVGAITEKKTAGTRGKNYSATTDRLPVRSW